METIRIRIEGTVPLLMHAFSDEAAMEATEGTRSSTAGERGTPREQAEACLYVGNGGEIIIPQPNLLACFTAAGKFFKIGRSKVTTQRTSFVSSAVTFGEMYYPLEFSEPWEVDSRPVKIPSTGGRIIRHRPMFRDWALLIEDMELDTEIIGLRLMRQIVDAAGKRIGLCDFRPDCKGPFGKFVVTEWKKLK